MKITIPKDVGGDLKVLPEGHCRAVVEGISVGTSKAGHPKATLRWVITTELYPSGSGESSVGERVLESFSLLPQAMWNLNALYKEVTGDSLPHGDFEPQELQEILGVAFGGVEADLILGNEPSGDKPGEMQTRVQERSVKR